jgi:hypothetical protein
MKNQLKVTDEIQTLIKYRTPDDEKKALELKKLYGINTLHKVEYSWHVKSSIIELSYFACELGINGIRFVLGTSNLKPYETIEETLSAEDEISPKYN